MTKTATALTALVLAAGLAGLAAPAQASVTVTAEINKTKDISVSEQVTVTKTVTIAVVFGNQVLNDQQQIVIDPLTLPAAAEAHALVNITNENNKVAPNYVGSGTSEQDPDPEKVHDLHRFAEINESVNENHGIIGVNQDTGNNSNQGNVVSFAYTNIQGAFVNSQAGGDQVNDLNVSDHRQQVDLPAALGTFDNPTDPRSLDNQWYDTIARIEGSIVHNTGIVGVNQNGGNMNNQDNLVAIAIGVNPTLALGEGALGQYNADNVVRAENTVKYDEIGNGSVSNNTGVVGVNQSVGNMNNQMNAFSLAAATAATSPVTTILGGPVNP